ncbi:MAG: hypothetical protein AAGF84_03085 [Planctomycetota bacterium]
MPAKPVKFSCRRLLAACAVLSPTLAAVPTADAVDRDWIGTGPVLFWDTGSNWTPAARPGAGDNLTFGIDTGGSSIIAGASSDSAQVLFDGFDWEITGSDARIDSTAQVFVRNDAEVTVSNTLLWAVTDRINVGDVSDGALTVQGEANVFGTSIRAGVAAGSTGTLTVGGDPNVLTRLQTSGTSASFGFFLGDAGTGILNVLPGGEARIFNDTSGSIADFELGLQETGVGVLNIDGGLVFAEDLTTGAGSATINVTNGGFLNQAVSTTPDAFLGIEATSTAAVRVAGENSRWNMNRLEIAQNGTATVSVEDGGRITNESTNDIVIGRDLDSSGKLAIVGTPESAPTAGDELISVLDANRDVIVGNAGQGEFRVGIGLTADLSGNPVGPGHADVDITSDLTLGFDATNVTNNVAYITGPNTDVTVGDILYIGLNGDAEMTVNGGATVTSRRPRVASGAGTTASLTIDGPGSSFTSTLDMTVGTSGDGTAVVSNGGALTTTDYLAVGFGNASDSSLTVDGPGSLVRVATNNAGDLHVGGFTSATGGTGTLMIQNGGRVEVSDEAYIGGNPTGDGTLIVTGAGSVYDHDEGNTGDNLHIGYRGAGVMHVLDGGVALTEETLIGEGTGSAPAELTISGAGSIFRTNGRLTVGDVRKSTMTVSDGALVTVGANPSENVDTQRLIIGRGSAADGSKLTLTGAGTRLEYLANERISVGLNGGSAADRATLEVLDGAVLNAVQRDGVGAVVSSGFVMIADESGANGQLTVAGPGSRIDARFMNVGDGPSGGATGIVDLTDGGVIELLDNVQVGSNGDGVGTINIGGLNESAQPFANVARLNVGNALEIGSDDPTNGDASGTVNVLANGEVNANGVFVGRTTGSFGTLTLGGLPDAPAVMNVADELVVAGSATSSQQSGSGTFNVNTNATVNIAGEFRVRDRGTVNINGGVLNFETLQLNNTSTAGVPTINFNAGTVRYDNAGTVNFDVLNSQVLLGETGLGSPGIATLVEGQTLAVESSDPADAGEINLIVPLRLNGGTLRVDAFTGNDTSKLDWDAGSLEVLRSTVTVGTAGLLGRTVALNAQQELHVDRDVTVQANGTLSITGDATTADTNEQFSAGSLGVFGLAVFTSTQVDADADDTGNALFNSGRIVLIDSDLTGDVANNASITLVGNSTINGGSFAATPASTLEVSLDPDQLSGALLSFTESADLTGRLDLDTDATNFALLPYQPLTLLESADVDGTFTQVIGNGLSNDEALAVTYSETAVLVTRALRGDANLNGQVEQSDLNAVLSNWGSTGQSWATGDLNGDGLVAQGDLNAVLSNWGSSTAPDFRGFAVPEPTAALALTALSALALRRRSA